LTRSHMTRHGNGPFVTQFTEGTSSFDSHNTSNAWQGQMRIGHLDAVALKYAIAAIGHIDVLAMTHAGRISGRRKLCVEYIYDGPYGLDEFFEYKRQKNGRARIQRIIPKERHVDDRKRMTEIIMGCTPVYKSATRTVWADLWSTTMNPPRDFIHIDNSYGDRVSVTELAYYSSLR